MSAESVGAGSKSAQNQDLDTVKFYGDNLARWDKDMAQGVNVIAKNILMGDGGVLGTVNVLPNSKRANVANYGKGISEIDMRLNWINLKHLPQLFF